jgi:hypothetical protein
VSYGCIVLYTGRFNRKSNKNSVKPSTDPARPPPDPARPPTDPTRPADFCTSKLDCPDARGNINSRNNIYCDNTGSVKSISYDGSIEMNTNDIAYFDLKSSSNGSGCVGTLNGPFDFTITNQGKNYKTYDNTLMVYADAQRKTPVNVQINYLEVILNENDRSQGKCIDASMHQEP